MKPESHPSRKAETGTLTPRLLVKPALMKANRIRRGTDRGLVRPLLLVVCEATTELRFKGGILGRPMFWYPLGGQSPFLSESEG